MNQIKTLKKVLVIMQILSFVFAGFISAFIPVILPGMGTYYFAGANYKEQVMPQKRMLASILGGSIIFFSFIFFYSGWGLIVSVSIFVANVIAVFIGYYSGNAKAKKNDRPIVNIN